MQWNDLHVGATVLAAGAMLAGSASRTIAADKPAGAPAKSGTTVSSAAPAAVESPKPDYPRINMTPGYEVDPTWPQRPLEYTWGSMTGIAVDLQDRIWTFNRGDMPVQVYTADGKFARAWGQGLVAGAHHIRVDPQGNIWIADVGLHVVRKFTPGGELLLTLGTSGEYGEDDKHLNKPTDMAITQNGEIFVTDGYGNNRIVRFAPNGDYLASWGRLGTARGEFSQPHAIAIDSEGLLYVVDRNNVRIQVFDQSGKCLDEWRNVITPWGIWITPKDEILVCGSSPMRWGERPDLASPPKDQLVVRFDRSGKVQELWTFPLGKQGESQPGELWWVHALAVDSQGNLYTGDIHGRGAQKFRRLNAAR